MADLTTQCSPNWCPGCGNLPIWAAFKQACIEKDWSNNNTAMVAGIGCHGHILNFTKITSFEGLHGRPLPVACGIKMANHDLNVFVFSGDGDSLGEGGNHFVHSARRNHDISLFLHDNALYALTTGQTSPATGHGVKTKSTPQGNPDNPLNPMALAIAAGATFVARVYAGDIQKVKEMMIAANEHKGFALVDILQPCTTFNKILTHEFFQENTYWLGDDYDSSDKLAAFAKVQEFGEKQVPLGIFYKEDKPSYESQLPQLEQAPLVESPTTREGLDKLYKNYI
ncbi:thiamine pyrophosphate-dependent enzyme [Patescibacteria group bacterium]